MDVFGGEEREDRQRQLGDVKDILHLMITRLTKISAC